MPEFLRPLGQARFALLYAALFWLVVVSLPGCASRGDVSGVSATQKDIVTESDESPERRRARIRVELALGYFEQGKTTIALDEIKQAIQADPVFFDAYNLRGLIYMRLNDPGLAEESFKKALVLKQNNPDVLHNLGWLKCQQAQYPQALAFFAQALANPQYLARAKTLMTQGLCQARAGMPQAAEQSLLKSYEYDAGNPVTGYNLANLLHQRGDDVRALFYIRRLNNSELANAESLWLGIKIEQHLGNVDAVSQLAAQLEKRFPKAPETALYQRGAFNE